MLSPFGEYNVIFNDKQVHNFIILHENKEITADNICYLLGSYGINQNSME